MSYYPFEVILVFYVLGDEFECVYRSLNGGGDQLLVEEMVVHSRGRFVEGP